MPYFGGFEASISVDGVHLPEYNVTMDGGEKRVSCWIPSEAGKVRLPDVEGYHV